MKKTKTFHGTVGDGNRKLSSQLTFKLHGLLSEMLGDFLPTAK